MSRYVIKDTQAYDKGQVVQAFDTKSFTMLQVQKDKDGKLCQVISNLKPYTQVHMCFSGADVLNISSEATRIAVKEGLYEGDHFSSSGAKDTNGNVMTLQDQIKKGVARKTHVLIRVKDMSLLGSTKEMDYDMLIISDSCNQLVPLE